MIRLLIEIIWFKGTSSGFGKPKSADLAYSQIPINKLVWWFQLTREIIPLGKITSGGRPEEVIERRPHMVLYVMPRDA